MGVIDPARAGDEAYTTFCELGIGRTFQTSSKNSEHVFKASRRVFTRSLDAESRPIANKPRNETD